MCYFFTSEKASLGLFYFFFIFIRILILWNHKSLVQMMVSVWVRNYDNTNIIDKSIDMFWNKMIFNETELNFLVVFINQQINIVPATLFLLLAQKVQFKLKHHKIYASHRWGLSCWLVGSISKLLLLWIVNNYQNGEEKEKSFTPVLLTLGPWRVFLDHHHMNSGLLLLLILTARF